MKVGFIGAGKMAEAIIASLVRDREAHAIFACEIDENRRRAVRKKYGINIYKHSVSVLESTSIVFLAVKPQDLDGVLREMAPHAAKNHLFISIAAGKKISGIKSVLGRGKMVRVMPNLATLVSEGMSVYCADRNVTEKDKKTVAGLLARFGRVLELPERDFDVVTALSGSGPAFFACFLEIMAGAAVKRGLNRKDALLLAEQTMLGTSKLLLDGGFDPESLIDAVTSPKGTTAAGMKLFRGKEFSSLVRKAINAAAKRSTELSK